MKCKERKYQFMRNQAKKAFSLLLALVMCLSVMSVGAFAESLPTSDGAVAQIGSTYYATLEDAISAAQSEDIIEILDGRWGADAIGTRDGAKWRDPSNLLRAKSLTIQPAEGATVTFTDDVYLGYDDCTTANATMTVTGLNFENATLSLVNYVQATVVGCNFVGSGANAALYISDSCSKNRLSTSEEERDDLVTVSNCTFAGTESGASGIRLRATGNVTLTGNTVANAAHNGIMIETHKGIDDQTKKVISITDNTITEWNAGNVAEGGRAMRLAFGTTVDGTHYGDLDRYDSVTIKDNYFTKGTLGLDSPDFVKISDTDNATVSLEHNSWSNNKLAVVNENSAFYTVNGATITINSVICDAASNAVAEVNGTEYETFEAAVEAAQDGQTVKLLDDVTYGEDHVVAVWVKDFNLDLNRHTFTTNSNQSISLSNNGYKATAICFGDGAVHREISISNGTIRTAYGAGVYLDGDVIATLSDLDVRQNHPDNVQTTDEYSAAIRLTSNANVIVISGSYYGKNAIAVSNSGGNVTVNGGTFTGDIFFNTSTDTGVTKSITINGGAFNGNIVHGDKGTLTIYGGVFSAQPDSTYLAENRIVIANTDAATRSAYPYKVVERNSQVWVDTVKVDMTGSASATLVVNVPQDYDKQNLNGGVEDVTTTKTVKATVGEDNQGRPTITANVPAKDMGAVMTVYDNGQPVYATSIKQYLTTLKNDATFGERATASYNYGTAAATYFGTAEKYGYTAADAKELSEAIGVVTASDVSDESIAPNAPVAGSTGFTVRDGLTYIGMSLLLEDNTSVRLNFRGDGKDYSREPVSTSNGTKYPVRRGNTDYWYVEVATDIGPAAYGTPYTVTGISDTFAKVSALSYVKTILNGNGYDAKLVDLAKALYKCYEVYSKT